LFPEPDNVKGKKQRDQREAAQSEATASIVQENRGYARTAGGERGRNLSGPIDSSEKSGLWQHAVLAMGHCQLHRSGDELYGK